MGVPSDGVYHDQGKRGDDARQVLHPQQCSETAAEDDHAEGRHEAEIKAGMKRGSAENAVQSVSGLTPGLDRQGVQTQPRHQAGFAGIELYASQLRATWLCVAL